MAEKILVVDDEREIADLVALYLKNEGYETRVCYNGQEALGQIQAGPVDLAILDVMLPEISGFELCRRIIGENTPYSTQRAKSSLSFAPHM